MESSRKSSRPHLKLLCAATFALSSFALCAHGQSAKEERIVSTAAAEAKLPRLVLILRHAEKSGDTNDPDINAVGRKRAALLPQLFVARPGGPVKFARPDALFATAPSKHSSRPAESAAPLGAALQERVNLDFGKDDEAALAREVLDGHYAGKVVLIVWHHGKIPALAQAFGVKDVPKWRDEVFDQIWEVTYSHGKAELATAPEQLMPGDSTK